MRGLVSLAMAVALFCGLAGAACSSAPEVEEKPPDALGWVVDWEQSPDYRFDVREGVTAGSVVLTLEDDTSFAVLPSTEISLDITCESLDASDLDYSPCWVHVGLSADRARAVWLTPFWAQGWTTPVPGTVPVADRVLTSERVAGEHDGLLVLTDGTVLPFDRSRVEMICLGGAPSIDEAIERFGHDGLLYVVLDQQTGAVIQLDCRLPI
jgi:hypothetical protein